MIQGLGKVNDKPGASKVVTVDDLCKLFRSWGGHVNRDWLAGCLAKIAEWELELESENRSPRRIEYRDGEGGLPARPSHPP